MKSIFLVLCFAIVLCSAVEESKHDAVDKLVKKLCIEYKRDTLDELVKKFCLAIDRGDVNEIRSLIESDVQSTFGDLKKSARFFSYLLRYTIMQQLFGRFNEEIFKLLIINGADLEALDGNGATPLYEAVDCDNAKAVKILLEYGAKPNVYNERLNITILQNAFLRCRMGYHSADIIDLLIERGADVDSNLLFIKNQMEIMSVVATRNMTRTHVLTQEEMKSLNIPVKE